jgi:quinol monooxygenase YgiN
MVARPDRADDLLKALQVLATRLSSLDGSEGIEVLADTDDPQVYIFIERWRSTESQKAAGALLGKEAFAAIGATLSRPPDSANLRVVGGWDVIIE